MVRVISIPNILDEFNKALFQGFHRFMLVVGEKNLGKSTLCLGLLYEIAKNFIEDYEERWEWVFKHIFFTPRQFYSYYSDAKSKIDGALMKRGIDPAILSMDVEQDWEKLVDLVLKQDIRSFEAIRSQYRIKGLLLDDIGAHLNRQDVSIYYDPFFQKLFGDLTLIRPYIAIILATAPDINDVPRVILKHVTDIIIVEAQGSGKYKKKKRFVRFKGKEADGYMKLYDGDPVEWKVLPEPVYAKYEVLRHVMSRHITQQANLHLGKPEKTADAPFIAPQGVEAAVKKSLSLIQLKKSIAESFKFQGFRVTESFTSDEPDLVVWKDALTPLEVVAIKRFTKDG